MVKLKGQTLKKKPSIVLLADRKGWAFDKAAKALSKFLSDDFDFTIRYVAEKPDLSRDKFDLIYVFFWGETYHLNYVDTSSQVIKEVSSHRWQNEEKYGFLTPEKFVETHLGDAGTVVTTSRRLQGLLCEYRDLVYCPNGFERDVFINKMKRKGELKIGWAGNQKDPCKGLFDIIEPACKHRYDLQIAGGDLSETEMVRFYNQIDVLCIASTAEGEPLTLIESMACGCFPVSTDVGIAPELINNGFNGLIVNRSVESFVKAFEWCEQNVDTIRRIGRINSDNLHSTRSWLQMIPAYKDIFLKSINKNLQKSTVKPINVPNSCNNDKQILNIKSFENNNEQGLSQSEIESSSKRDYVSHLTRMNPGQNSEAVYFSAINYYNAEIKPILPLSREANIVDIGSGFGHFSRYLIELGYKHIGCIDSSNELLEIVKSYLSHALEFAYSEDGIMFLTKNRNTFDVITFIDVIEHFSMEEAEKILISAFHALRPKGRVIIRTPNMANILGTYSRYIDLTHFHGYTEFSLKQLLEIAGFQQIHLNVPDWTGSFRRSFFGKINFFLHRMIYTLNDRVQPQCFDKNIIIYAEK